MNPLIEARLSGAKFDSIHVDVVDGDDITFRVEFNAGRLVGVIRVGKDSHYQRADWRGIHQLPTLMLAKSLRDALPLIESVLGGRPEIIRLAAPDCVALITESGIEEIYP